MGERELTCLSCGGPLDAREGRFCAQVFLHGPIWQTYPAVIKAARPQTLSCGTVTKVVQVSRAVWHMDRQINLDPNCPSCPGAAMPGLFLSDLSHSPVVLLTRNRHVV